MTSRVLAELEALESPRKPIETPQFTSGKGFFPAPEHPAMDDLFDEPQNLLDFDAKVPVLSSDVVQLSGLGVSLDSLKDLHLQVECTPAHPSLSALRATAESAISQIKTRYLELEAELLPLLGPEEQELMQLTKPLVLMEAQGREDEEEVQEMKAKVNELRREVEEMREKVVREQEVIAAIAGEKLELTAGERNIVDFVVEEWERREKELRNDQEIDKNRLEEGLREEIRQELTSEYEEKLRKRLNQQPTKRPSDELQELRRQIADLEAFRENVEVEFEVRLATAKEMWRQEMTALALEDHEKALARHYELQLAQRTQEIQAQSKAEVAQVSAQFRREAQEAISVHLQRLADDSVKRTESQKQLLREECLNELRSEREMKLAEALTARLTVQIDKELKLTLTPKIEKELKTTLEEKLRMEVRKEFEDIFETRRNQMEMELKSKLKHATERVEGRFEEEVSRLVTEKTAKIEKELKVKYKTKLDREIKLAKEQALEEYKEKQTADIEEIRREKTEIARLKAALNVQMRKKGMERKEETEKIRKMEMELERKGREIEFKAGKISESQENRPKMSENSLKSRESRIFSPEKPQVFPKISPEKAEMAPISFIPRPVSPPEASETAVAVEEQPRFLPRYDSEDLVKQLIAKNLEEAQREAVNLLQLTEKPPIVTSQYYPKETVVQSVPGYYVREQSEAISKADSSKQVYYRSKEEGRKDTAAHTPTARQQLYQELLRDKLKR